MFPEVESCDEMTRRNIGINVPVSCWVFSSKSIVFSTIWLNWFNNDDLIQIQPAIWAQGQAKVLWYTLFLLALKWSKAGKYQPGIPWRLWKLTFSLISQLCKLTQNGGWGGNLNWVQKFIQYYLTIASMTAPPPLSEEVMFDLKGYLLTRKLQA